MANPNPKHKFSKGNKANPHGRPRLPQELKEFRKHFDPKVWESFSTVLEATPEELKKIRDSKDSTSLQVLAAKAVLGGDIDTLVKLHLIPKPKDEVMVTGNAVQVVIGIPSNGSEKPKDGA